MTVAGSLPESVRLSARDLANLSRAQSVLLAPFAHSTSAAWCRAVNDAVRLVVDADRVAFFMPELPAGGTLNPSGLDPARGEAASIVRISDEFSLESLSAYPRLMEPDLLDRPLFARACALGAASRDQMIGGETVAYYGSSYYQDYLVPNRALDCVMMTSSAIPSSIIERVVSGELRTGDERPSGDDEQFLPDSPSLTNSAQLLLYHDAIVGPRFDSHDLALLALIYPSFRAGVEARWRVGTANAKAALTLDGVGIALVAFGSTGAVIHRTSAFGKLEAEEPSPERLNAAIRDVAREFVVARNAARATRKTSDAALVSSAPIRRFATPRHRYLLRLVLLDGLFDSSLSGGVTTGVTIERVSSERPTTTEMGRRLGLTPAQCTVALAVAEGRSNAEIARQIGVSVHTVRHHVEQAFDRVGVRTRSALAVHVLTIMRSPEF